MAAGSIIIDLLMRTGAFETDTKRAERQLKNFQKEAEKAGKIAGAALGAGLVGAAYGFERLIDGAAGLKDLEEVSGIPAEIIGSFSVAAGVAGTSLEQISEASLKLRKNLLGVDDDSKAAGAALAALSIPIEDFKRLDPGEQIEQASKALSQIGDTATRSQLAIALFGKSGAQLLPFLLELEAQGGRQVILTQQQIELADAYADRQARVVGELRQYAQLLAVQALPAVNAFIEAGAELAAELTGVDRAGKKLADGSGVAEFAEDAVRALAFVVDSGQGVVRVFQTVGAAIGSGLAIVAAVADGDVKQALEIARQAREDVDKILSAEFFSAKLDRALSKSKAEARQRAIEDRGFDPTKGQNRVDFDGGNKVAKERTSEAQRYLETLQKQAEKTLELTALEQALFDIQSGRIQGLTPELERQIVAQAEFNDLNRQAIEIRDAEVGALTARNRAALDNLDTLKKGNDELRNEIALIGLDELGVIGVERARISSTRALKEEELARRAAAGASDESLQQLEAEIALLREREGLLGEKIGRTLEQKNIEAARDAGEKTRDTLGDSIEQGILDGYRKGQDATSIFLNELKAQFAKTILRPLIQPVADAGNQLIGDILSSIAGAFAPSGAGIVSGGSSESLTGEIIRGRRAGGGDANPNPFGALLVGENGPELFKPSTSGRIIPNGALQGGDRAPRVIVENHGARVQTRREGNGDLRVIVDAVKSEIGRDVGAGGPIAKTLQSRGVNLSATLPRRG